MQLTHTFPLSLRFPLFFLFFPSSSFSSSPSSSLFFFFSSSSSSFFRSVAVLSQAVRGLGGVGKTSVAKQYCSRFFRLYPGGVFFVVLDTEATFEESVRAILLNDLHMCKAPEMSGRELRTSFLTWLRDHRNWFADVSLHVLSSLY